VLAETETRKLLQRSHGAGIPRPAAHLVARHFRRSAQQGASDHHAGIDVSLIRGPRRSCAATAQLPVHRRGYSLGRDLLRDCGLGVSGGAV